MPYKLYTDKSEDFTCEINIKNASLKGSMARLVVESADGINLVFNGKIEGGKCNIPVRRLRGLLDENITGKMFLEVIIEDIYFRPWTSDFIIENNTSVKVTVNEQKTPSRPIVEVKVPSNSKKVTKNMKESLVPLYELTRLCEHFKITKANLPSRKRDLLQIINEYFKSNQEFKKHKSVIISDSKYFIK